jgi:beta-glucosidase
MDYEEGLFIGYRWYDRESIEPLFPFGHGLSYTSFEYSNLRAIPPKGDSSVAAFEVDITNTGDVAGKEVLQGYITVNKSQIERPQKELKKFEKISLESGETKKVKFELSEKDLSFWSTENNAWQVEPAEYLFSIGASATDIKDSVSVWLG